MIVTPLDASVTSLSGVELLALIHRQGYLDLYLVKPLDSPLIRAIFGQWLQKAILHFC